MDVPGNTVPLSTVFFDTTVRTVNSRQQKNIDSGPSVRHFVSNRGHFFFRQPDFLYIRKREKMGIFGNFYYGPFLFILLPGHLNFLLAHSAFDTRANI